LSAAPVHHVRSRLKNDVVQPMKLFDGLIRYDPAKRAFSVEPISHHDALGVHAWKEAMDTEFQALATITLGALSRHLLIIT
jgi:hypothetical protein